MKFKLDPLITGILTALIAGILIPTNESFRTGASIVADVAVFCVFLVYGMRLPTREVWNGMKNIRMQSMVLAATYVIFPLLGWGLSTAAEPIIGPHLALGVLYLSLLPSTVQSSVTFTSIARGDVAGAVCAATISNLLGMVLTPVLVLFALNIDGAQAGSITTVLMKLLLPFVVGQILQIWVGEWMRTHKKATILVDRGAIVTVVFSATVDATAQGAWTTVTGWGLALLIGVLAVLLALMLGLTWGLSRRMPIEERIVVLMCGSKKSLATGLPMAKAMFSPAVIGTVAVPVIIFHQIQLMVCALLARKLAKRPE